MSIFIEHNDNFSFFVAGPELYVAVVLSVICFIPLVMMKSVRNLVAPPILIITDSKEFSFNFPTVSFSTLFFSHASI